MRNLQVYVAAPYTQMERAERIASLVSEQSKPGHRLYVISRWHRYAGQPRESEARICNMLDLEASDLLIALTDPALGREIYVEIGFHLGRAKRVIWWPNESHPCLSLEHHPQVFRVETLQHLLENVRLHAAAFDAPND